MDKDIKDIKEIFEYKGRPNCCGKCEYFWRYDQRCSHLEMQLLKLKGKEEIVRVTRKGICSQFKKS